MAWFRVDDGFPDHPKLEVLHDRPNLHGLAVALWVLMGADCMKPERRTNGKVTIARLLRVLPWPRETVEEAARALVECGLWRREGKAFVFHDWQDYQPSADDIQAQRAANAERQKRWKSKHKGSGNGVSNGDGNASPNASSNGQHNASSNGVRNATITRIGDALGDASRAFPSRPVSVKHTACAQESAHASLPPASGGEQPENPDHPSAVSGGLPEAVREALEAGLRELGQAVPSWTPTNLGHVGAVSTWLVENHPSDPIAALGLVLRGWFADAWTARQGFPLGDLANRTGKYFAGAVEAPGSFGARVWEALDRKDMATYHALIAQKPKGEG